jgi:hypothetical protein
MANRKSIASVLLFVGSALCFLLPFVTVSCGGVTAFTLTGQQLATGTTLTQPLAFGPPQKQKIDSDPFALVAGLCAIAGVALSLIGRKLASAAAVSGGAGAVSLFVMRSRLDEQLQKQAAGMASAHYETGFTLAVLLLIAGAAWNVYLFLQSRRLNEAVPSDQGVSQGGSHHSPSQSSSPPGPLEMQGSLIVARDSGSQTQAATGNKQFSGEFCSHCGEPMEAGMRFCESCGKSAELDGGNI